jgi:SAM-dependent methyltransferase
MSYPIDIHTGVTGIEAEVLERYAEGRRVLECGSWYGFSTIVMARVAEHVDAVDWHHGDPHAGQRDTEGDFRQNLIRYNVDDRVTVHVGRFEDVLPMLVGRWDVVFLDGMHDAASVTRDLALLEPIAGRHLLLHDYDVPVSWGFEVRETVDAWLAAHPEWVLVDTVDKLAIVERR